MVASPGGLIYENTYSFAVEIGNTDKEENCQKATRLDD